MTYDFMCFHISTFNSTHHTRRFSFLGRSFAYCICDGSAPSFFRSPGKLKNDKAIVTLWASADKAPHILNLGPSRWLVSRFDWSITGQKIPLYELNEKLDFSYWQSARASA